MTTPTVLHHKIIEMIKYENTCQYPDRYQLDVALSRDGQPDSLLSWTTLSFDSAGSRKRSALLSGILDSDSVQSRTASVWLTAVMDSSQLSSTLSWTVLKRCLGQLSTWLSAITDSFQLWINAVPKRAQLDSAWSRTALRWTQYCLAQFISANKV